MEALVQVLKMRRTPPLADLTNAAKHTESDVWISVCMFLHMLDLKACYKNICASKRMISLHSTQDVGNGNIGMNLLSTVETLKYLRNETLAMKNAFHLQALTKSRQVGLSQAAPHAEDQCRHAGHADVDLSPFRSSSCPAGEKVNYER